MKLWLTDVDEFVSINNLQEIKSPILFQRGSVPHPEGLISNEIFGLTTRERKTTFAYIDLHGHYLHPHVYKVLKSVFSNLDGIINGSLYFSIVDGVLVQDPNGNTGLKWLYENWDKIDWKKKMSDKEGIRNERIDLLTGTKKNVLFMTKQIVIPAFYRDISSNQSGGGGSTSELNSMYARIIRSCSLSNSEELFDFVVDSSVMAVQNDINNIYNYFKEKIEKKQGLMRKYLMGKNVDGATRVVITATTFHAEDPNDMIVSYEYAGIPISQLCGLVHPFIVSWLKGYFEREFIEPKYAKQTWSMLDDNVDLQPIMLDNPETYFTDKYIRNLIDTYIRNPESRFDPIEVPVKGNKKRYIAFTGQFIHKDGSEDRSSVAYRKMTITDLLFIACSEVVKGKYSMLTRYPVNDQYGICFSKIHVVSTAKTVPMQVNGEMYKWYPYIEEGLAREEVMTKFIDAVQYSDSYLNGMGADFDGDQITIKVLYTQEANAEVEKLMRSKGYFMNTSGKNVRIIEIEPIQTYFVLSKDPNKDSKEVTGSDLTWLLDRKPTDFTFSTMVYMLGDLKDDSDRKVKNVPKYNIWDTITVPANKSPTKKELKTTVGRWVLNKVLFERTGMYKAVGYINDVVTDGKFQSLETIICQALLDDVITIDEMYQWQDIKNWFGQQMHAVVTTSFSPAIIKTPDEIKKRRAELVKQHKKELEEGNMRVSSDIENELINMAKDYYKDDYGLDLYASGARGSLGNNYKNNNLFRGGVKNPATGKFDIIENGLLDGLKIKDLTAASNTILGGAYPKSCQTAETGYLAKQIMAALQTEVLDVKGSDCGSVRTLDVELTPENKSLYDYRYIKNNKGELICLTPDVIDKYVGKTVKMRSPMMCVGKRICNKCAGDLYYKLGIENAGLTASKVATVLTNLNMKKFHDSTIKYHKINPETCLF